MDNIYKSYCVRLFKDKIFIVCCILAFALTFWYTCRGESMAIQKEVSSSLIYSNLASLGILFFFSFFTALFLGKEFDMGTIRNKLICGCSRTKIYLSALAVIMTAVLTMTACWLCGAVIGAKELPNAGVIISNAFKVAAYTVYISMNLTKRYRSAVVGILSFQFCSFTALVINTVGFSEQGVKWYIARAIINLMPYGQWICLSELTAEGFSMNTAAQLGLSLLVAVFFTILGIMTLRKKDII